MRQLAPWLSLAVLSWLPGCGVADQFACSADEQCVTHVAAGRCEAEGVCSFPDQACPSGRRFGALAGELSGECVGEGSGDGGTSTEPGMTSSAAESTPSPDGSGPSTTSTTSTTSTSTPASTSTTAPDPGTGATSIGPQPNDPYGPCTEDTDCVEPDSYCITTPGGLDVCSPPCGNMSCTYEGMATATPACLPVFMTDQGCVLLCDGGTECPVGMICELVRGMGVGLCAWPAGAGP